MFLSPRAANPSLASAILSVTWFVKFWRPNWNWDFNLQPPALWFKWFRYNIRAEDVTLFCRTTTAERRPVTLLFFILLPHKWSVKLQQLRVWLSETWGGIAADTLGIPISSHVLGFRLESFAQFGRARDGALKVGRFKYLTKLIREETSD